MLQSPCCHSNSSELPARTCISALPRPQPIQLTCPKTYFFPTALMSWTGSWRYSRSPRASVRWVVGRGGREQRPCSPLSSASRLSLTCPPEASPDIIPVTWDPAALPEVNTLITHSKMFRCLYFSSSQICSLANASPHLSPREKISKHHWLPIKILQPDFFSKDWPSGYVRPVQE